MACRYQAVVTGAIESDSGVFNAALNGKESVTKYRVVERCFEENIVRSVTTVDLERLTGRQHQLRKHLVRSQWDCYSGMRTKNAFAPLVCVCKKERHTPPRVHHACVPPCLHANAQRADVGCVSQLCHCLCECSG